MNAKALTIQVTEADIRGGRRGDFGTHPLLSAVARALGESGFDLVDGEEPFLRLADGARVRLPRRCHYFLRVWEYGPSGGAPFAIRNRVGEILALRTWDEIICPFSFTLMQSAEVVRSDAKDMD